MFDLKIHLKSMIRDAREIINVKNYTWQICGSPTIETISIDRHVFIALKLCLCDIATRSRLQQDPAQLVSQRWSPPSHQVQPNPAGSSSTGRPQCTAFPQLDATQASPFKRHSNRRFSDWQRSRDRSSWVMLQRGVGSDWKPTYGELSITQ